MSKLPSRRRLAVPFCLFVAALLVFAVLARAGLRGPGKYCGVVIFDRWGTCFLLSGHYITYISESVKNDLRSYAGKAMQIDASSVDQPRNPGDALIRKYTILGPAPDTHQWATLDGLELIAKSDFGPYGNSTFLLEIRNTGSSPISINRQNMGPTLLAAIADAEPLALPDIFSRKLPRPLFAPSDGPSMAVITRLGFVNLPSWITTIDGVTRSWSYTIDSCDPPSESLALAPGESMQARITFHIPPGQYQFLFGYGGGVHEEKSLASNAISFDLSPTGVASLVH